MSPNQQIENREIPFTQDGKVIGTFSPARTKCVGSISIVCGTKLEAVKGLYTVAEFLVWWEWIAIEEDPKERALLVTPDQAAELLLDANIDINPEFARDFPGVPVKDTTPVPPEILHAGIAYSETLKAIYEARRSGAEAVAGRQEKSCFDELVNEVLYWRNGVLPFYWRGAFHPGDFQRRTADPLRRCLVCLDAKGFNHLSARLQYAFDEVLRCVSELDTRYDNHPAPDDATESDSIRGKLLLPCYDKTIEFVSLVEDMKKAKAESEFLIERPLAGADDAGPAPRGKGPKDMGIMSGNGENYASVVETESPDFKRAWKRYEAAKAAGKFVLVDFFQGACDILNAYDGLIRESSRKMKNERLCGFVCRLVPEAPFDNEDNYPGEDVFVGEVPPPVAGIQRATLHYAVYQLARQTLAQIFDAARRVDPSFSQVYGKYVSSAESRQLPVELFGQNSVRRILGDNHGWNDTRFATRVCRKLKLAPIRRDKVILGLEVELLRAENRSKTAIIQRTQQLKSGEVLTDVGHEQVESRTLSETEEGIMNLLLNKPMKGEIISREMGLSYDYTRQILARLKKRGLIRNGRDGYYPVK
jgi:hypothetical protein